MLYNLVKAAHIVLVIAWMAGLMIYPRYKIHQLAAQPGEPLFETMKMASIRLKRIILTPSMILVWLAGLSLLALNPDLLSQGWFHIKLLLVVILTGFHGWFTYTGRKIDQAVSTVDSKKLRLLNEVPFLLMIGIVFLVIMKPF